MEMHGDMKDSSIQDSARFPVTGLGSGSGDESPEDGNCARLVSPEDRNCARLVHHMVAAEETC